jgi:hypothetical protein
MYSLPHILQFIRHGFISKLNAALLAAFPARKDVSQMSLVERSRLYFTASQVALLSLNTISLADPSHFFRSSLLL